MPLKKLYLNVIKFNKILEQHEPLKCLNEEVIMLQQKLKAFILTEQTST